MQNNLAKKFVAKNTASILVYNLKQKYSRQPLICITWYKVCRSVDFADYKSCLQAILKNVNTE